MDIQNLANVSTVVINSLLMLLKDNHIDVNSVVMQLSNNKDEAISPEVNLGELIQQTINELQEAKAQKVAVPDTHILMPKEPTSKHAEAFWNNFLVERPNAQTMYFAYKAMIEAQEQGND